MKDKIRKRLLKERAEFRGENRRAADLAILENVMAALSGYDSFFVYNSFSGEADTSRIISALLNAGKSVYLPRVEGDKIVPAPYGQTVKGAFGIEEPTGQAFKGSVQVTVTPLIAVNAKGFRIGYGKGFYDRYFEKAATLKVGLGYVFQICDFKEDGWDVPLDMFICDKGIIEYAKKR